MHVGHELVEVRAAFAPYRARREEQIHQHGLAAADVAVNVEAADRPCLRSLLPNSQPSAEDLRDSRCCASALSSRVELRGDRLLRGIALDLAFGDEGRVTLGDGRWHRRGGECASIGWQLGMPLRAAPVNANNRANPPARISRLGRARSRAGAAHDHVFATARRVRDEVARRNHALEKSRRSSIFREHRRARDTHDTIATRSRNTRNAAEKVHSHRSRVVHEIRDFPRCLVISY